MHRSTFVLATTVTLTTLAFAGCGDDESGTVTTTNNTTSSTGGSGGAGGSGAAGGSGGSGAQGGGGAGGCLPTSVHEDLFTVADTELCVVETYEADVFVGTDMNFFASAPTWGAHDGPLLVRSGPAGMEDDLQLTRLSLNGDTLMAATETVDLMIPAGFFLGSQALDVPGTGWTLISWTGLDSSGEVIAIDNGAEAASFPMVGFFSGATVGSGDTARVLHTGLSELGQGDPNQGMNGLYAADFCAGPALCNNGTLLVDSWGGASGAATSDQDGNAFVILTNPSFLGGDDTQTLRGFGADAAAHMSGATMGTDVFTIDGFGYALAARSPSAEQPGLVMFQPFNPTTFAAEDVIVQRYDIAGGDIVPQGMPVVALSMVTPGTEVVLVSDPSKRIWVGHGVSEQPAQSRWFVIDSAQ